MTVEHRRGVVVLALAPLTRRFGRPVVLGIGHAIFAIALLGLAWAGTSSALWPLVLALLPAGFSSGIVVPTMTTQAIGAVEPSLHGAAAAAFNTSRQIGAAIGVATFGPLLGTSHDLTSGFITCVIVAAAAATLTLLLTAVAGLSRTVQSSGLVRTRNLSRT